MSNILHEMNAATTPFTARAPEPTRQIRNYFSLLSTMMKLGLQLIWERQNGLKHFTGILDSLQGREMYNDIIRCIMRPEEENSDRFAPQEIDGIAEVLAKRGMTTVKALDYLRVVIAVKMENEALEYDGDTHQPSIGWVAPQLEAAPELEFRDNA
jgi:hypothetical protein